jgi:hypothetical protein
VVRTMVEKCKQATNQVIYTNVVIMSGAVVELATIPVFTFIQWNYTKQYGKYGSRVVEITNSLYYCPNSCPNSCPHWKQGLSKLAVRPLSR